MEENTAAKPSQLPILLPPAGGGHNVTIEQAAYSEEFHMFRELNWDNGSEAKMENLQQRSDFGYLPIIDHVASDILSRNRTDFFSSEGEISFMVCC